jgi:hypothetical protein
MLDVEQTFDIIEWDFLFLALSKLGFSPEWVKWVLALYWHSTFEIKINGEIGEVFSLHRFVRQGYPITPIFRIGSSAVPGTIGLTMRMLVHSLQLLSLCSL